MPKPIPKHDSPRKRALDAGQPRYKDSPCEVCGHKVRYTSCGNCVKCNNRRAKEYSKQPEVAARRRARYHEKKRIAELAKQQSQKV